MKFQKRSSLVQGTLSVMTPNKRDTDRLGEVLKRLGIEEVFDRGGVLGVKPVLVQGGTDGAPVNISKHYGMRVLFHGSFGNGVMHIA